MFYVYTIAYTFQKLCSVEIKWSSKSGLWWTYNIAEATALFIVPKMKNSIHCELDG